MCGIAGFVGKGTKDELERMTRSLSHRGPDDEGFLMRGDVGLGHRRLSILDTSMRGHQPMTLEKEDVAIIFNGEIYNFRALRDELKKGGRVFSSHSDTEVLLHLYAVHGDDFLKKTIGMFAIALYDFKNEKLILARDRMGEKPLYWSLENGAFRFASELRALIAGGVKNQIDRLALEQYLQFDYVPTPRTIFAGINKLEPATMMIYEKGTVKKIVFWAPSHDERGMSESNALSQLDTLISESISRQLVSDVPLGVFLSGGLDSSTVAYYATRASPHIHTFSIGFDDPSFDESVFARMAAQHLGTTHHELTMRERDALELIKEIPEVFSEPVADASVIPTMFLSRFARQSVTVALGGDGGDELFVGYPTFQADSLFRMYKYTPFSVRALLKRGVDALPASHENFSFSYNLQKFVSSDSRNPVQRHFEWLGTFNEDNRAALLGSASSRVFSEVEAYANEYRGAPENRLLFVYMRTYLMDQVLAKVDRASMRYALEIRAPFLDHTVVDALFSLPFSLKYRHGTTKYLLKQLMRDKLPAELIKRKKKGFGIPLARWLTGPLRNLCEELLSPQALRVHGLFDEAAVARIKHEHMTQRHDRRKELWNLMVFQMWYERWLR